MRRIPAEPIDQQAGQMVADALREAGIRLERGNDPEIKRHWYRWLDLRISRAEFIAVCRSA
jgi:hypothetical protein